MKKQFRVKENQPAFEVVEGPLAGRKFMHGRAYAEIPPGYRARFEAVAEKAPAETGGKQTKSKE